MRKLISSPSGLVGLLLVIALVALAILAPMVWGDRAEHIDAASILEGPSAAHPLGTDGLGRDILARVLVATRLSLGLAFLATAIGVGIGIPWGLLPTALPHAAARLVAGSINTLVGFPGLLLAMFTTVVMGLGARGAVLGIGVAIAPALARLTHNLASSVASADYVAAAKVLNVPGWRITSRHIAPNIAEPLILNVTLIMGSALLGLAALSFLGLGVQPPSYDWGRMLTEGLLRIYVDPEVALGPAVAITAAGIGFNLLGESLARIAARESTSAANVGSGPDGVPVGPGALPGAPTIQEMPGRNGPAATLGGAKADPDYPRVADPGVRDEPSPIAGDVLELTHLTVAFGGVTPVQDVSLSVRSGEIVGVVGESGSGKSLTALAISGLVPFPGRVTTTRHAVAGTEVWELSTAQRRKLLGTSLAMIFQDPLSSLNPVLRIGNQLAEIPVVHEGAAWSDARERAVQRLAEVGIPSPAERARQRPHEFSGGMRQRAIIAMGMMGTPRLIIADEPTTALDVTIQRQILDLLGAITSQTGAGAVFISHDIAVVSQLCHRVVVMYAGRVVEELPTDDLKSRAAHPYTRALIASLPDMRTDRQRPLVTIPGAAPTAGAVSGACAFASRCTHATSICREQRPPLTAMPGGRRLACWHPQSTEPASATLTSEDHG